ncbi:MAG: hypothetical protein R3232_10835 [Clostridia bacterium]|nr:hypothetical protein [Clostridia bacterium]
MKLVRKILFCGFILMMASVSHLSSQPVPASDENIPYLMTFGLDGERSWGDDDFSQTFFFKIPTSHTDPFYIRVYDPDIGGDVDEIRFDWNTRMKYSVYGGYECCSIDEAKGIQPTGNYRSGVLMQEKVFGFDMQYDDDWYTFGPFNPIEGELIEEFGGYIFKIIAEGISGDDGNLYRYYLSKDPDENIPIEDGNAFTYEYTFRMWNNVDEVSHIYPFVDTGCIFIRTTNWDWDNDGFIRVVSNVREGQYQKISGENDEATDMLRIDDEEINTSLDFQFHKRKPGLVRNNNVVISVENQYGEALPFFTVPIGGVPVYQGGMNVQRIRK